MTTGLTDLEQIERDAFRRFYDDGIFDIYLGVILITMGIAAWISDRVESEATAMLITLGLAILVTVPLLVWRRHLIRSRLGTFKPGPARQRKITGTRLVLLGSVVLGIIVFGVAAAAIGGNTSAEVLGAVIPLVWFVNAVVVLGAMAYLLDVPRFYFHGVLFGLVMPTLIWPAELWDIEVEPLLAFGVLGSIIAAVGIYKLVHFLKDYPAPAAGEPNGHTQ